MAALNSFSNTLDILLYGLFDYAGLYPPENKSFEEAFKIATTFNETLKRPHIVGAQIVLDFNQLDSINPAALSTAGFSQKTPFKVCVLGSPLRDRSAAISEERLTELTAIQEGNVRFLIGETPFYVASYELRLDSAIQTQREFVKIALRNIKSYFQEESILLAVEPDLSDGMWQETLFHITQIISDLNEHCKGPPLALKVRCAGQTALSVEKLADVVDVVSRLKLPLKATAGLHHPIIESSRYQNQFGFLNLLAALVISSAEQHQSFRNNIIECLSSVESTQFRFGAGFSWSKYSVTKEEVLAWKEHSIFSIGSCSLHEPDSDLVRLFKD